MMAGGPRFTGRASTVLLCLYDHLVGGALVGHIKFDPGVPTPLVGLYHRLILLAEILIVLKIPPLEQMMI